MAAGGFGAGAGALCAVHERPAGGEAVHPQRGRHPAADPSQVPRCESVVTPPGSRFVCSHCCWCLFKQTEFCCCRYRRCCRRILCQSGDVAAIPVPLHMWTFAIHSSALAAILLPQNQASGVTVADAEQWGICACMSPTRPPHLHNVLLRGRQNTIHTDLPIAKQQAGSRM